MMPKTNSICIKFGSQQHYKNNSMKVTYYVASSLHGYIAKEDLGIAWLEELKEHLSSMTKLFTRHSNLIKFERLPLQNFAD